MTLWQNYVLPILIPIIGGVAVFVSAKLSQRSATASVEVESKSYGLDVLKTSLSTLTQEVSRAQDQLKAIQGELSTERLKGEQYRAKVDELEAARIRSEVILLDRDRHIGLLERWIADEKSPPPPPRPW